MEVTDSLRLSLSHCLVYTDSHTEAKITYICVHVYECVSDFERERERERERREREREREREERIRGAFFKFPDLFCIGIHVCRRFLKIQNVIAIHLMRSLTNIYDFSFKWTATLAIAIHPTKAWLLQLVKLKNAIWHFRRRICNKIVF